MDVGRLAVLGRLRRRLRGPRQEDRRAPSPSCSHLADVSFGVLGNGETCTGDPARRAGNEFVYQGLAAQNIETLHRAQGQAGRHHLRPLLQHPEERVPRPRPRARGRPPHPAAQPAGPRGAADAGRATGAGAAQALDHLPRPVLPRPPQPGLRPAARAPAGAARGVVRRDGAVAERSFCCGAGGARMWMEENLGERINVNRTKEAVATGADQIAVGCPFCRVMLSDGLTAEQADGRRARGGRGPRRRADAAGVGEGRVRHPRPGGCLAGRAPAEPRRPVEETKAESEPPSARAGPSATRHRRLACSTSTSPWRRSSPPSPRRPPTGGSLFDVETGRASRRLREAPSSTWSRGGAGADRRRTPCSTSRRTRTAVDDEPEAEVKTSRRTEPRKDVDLNEGGSLFDL